jgi:hypothetical protein
MPNEWCFKPYDLANLVSAVDLLGAVPWGIADGKQAPPSVREIPVSYA